MQLLPEHFYVNHYGKNQLFCSLKLSNIIQSIMEEDEISELDRLFLNTQAQSNLDMWDDSILKQKSENELASSLLRRFAYKDNLGRDSIFDVIEDSNDPNSNLNPRKFSLEEGSRTEDKKPKTEKKILALTSNKKRKKSDSVKRNQKLESIGAHVTKLYSEQKNSLFKLLSGKKKKMNDLLSTIDEIENGKLHRNSNEMVETSEECVSDIMYSKDEWFNLLKVIRVNFPNLSKRSKLTLSKINKAYEEHYDSLTEVGTPPLLNFVDDETPYLWNMASSFPKTRLTDEDLKWLYDLDDNNLKTNNVNSSFVDIDDGLNEENNIYTLSQLIEQHRTVNDYIPDNKSNIIIDLTQNVDDALEKSCNNDTGTYQAVNSTLDNPKLNNDHGTEMVKEIGTPSKSIKDEADYFIPCSSPRASPIVVSPKKIENIKKKLEFFRDRDSQVKTTISPQKQKNLIKDPLDYAKASRSEKVNIPQNIIGNDSNQIEVIPDSEDEDAVTILSSNIDIFTKALEKIEPHFEKNSIGYKWDDTFLHKENYSIDEKEKSLSEKDGTEVNQLKCLALDLAQETQISDSDVDSCKSVYLSARQVKSSCNSIKKKKTRYEFKGHLSSVFEAPFGKFIETKITHERRFADPEVVLDTESENDGEISIIEIVKEVRTKQDLTDTDVSVSLNDRFESKQNPNGSEIQVFSSQNMDHVDPADKIEAHASQVLVHPFVDSSVLQAFNEFTVIGTRLLLSKWGFKSKKSKKENSKFLSTVYTIICLIKKEFTIEIQSQDLPTENQTKETTAKDRQEIINQFYDKLLMIRSQDVQNALFNFISDIVEQDEGLYSKILKYVPITLTEIQKLLHIKSIDIDKEILRTWADNTSVTYTMEWRTSNHSSK